MSNLAQDLRYALRSLTQSPGFALVAVLTLAIGIGANTAIFSVINAILFRPYPYADPDRLVVVQSLNAQSGVEGGDLSYPDFLDYREQNRALEGIALVRVRGFNLAGASGEPIQVKGAVASPELFELVGGKALVGRTFRPEEGVPGRDGVVVLSQRLWERSFEADTGIVGKTIRLDSRPYQVVGVVPPSAQFPDIDAAEMFVPLAETAASPRQGRSYMALARLKGGTSLDEAQAELSGIAQRLEQDHPETNEAWGVQILTLREFRTERFRSLSTILFGVVGFVLLIACANVANLLLQRAGARQREIAIRSAIGANRTRLVSQLLTESLVLSVLGSALGLLLSVWGLRLLVNAIPQELPSYMNDFSIDGKVLAFTVVISLVTATLFGLAPTLRLARPNLTETLGDAGARSSGGARRQRLRKALVMSEVALSVILLIAAGLMIKSFRRLQEVDPGFNVKKTLTVQVTLPTTKYPEPQQRAAFLRQAMERLAGISGVEAAAATSDLPIGQGVGVLFTADGQSEDERKRNPEASLQLIGGDFFRALDIPIVKGRAFDSRDAEGNQQVIIVSNALAGYLWPGADPIGKRLRLDIAGGDPWLTVVGVAADTLGGPQRRREQLPELYAPYPLRPETAFNTMDLVVRTSGDPATAAAPLRRELQALDPDLPAANVQTLDQALSESLWLQRISSMLFGVFAAVALVLAAVGMYGTAAYSVSQRTREIGIRMALGARGQDVLRMVMGQALVTVAIALAIGLAGAFALSRLLGRLLYDVKSTDPVTFLSVALLVGAVALLANYVPALRATRVRPVVTLKYE